MLVFFVEGNKLLGNWHIFVPLMNISINSKSVNYLNNHLWAFPVTVTH